MKFKTAAWMVLGIIGIPLLSSCTPDRANADRDLSIAEGMQVQRENRADKYKNQASQDEANAEGRVTTPQAEFWQEDADAQRRREQAGVVGEVETTPDGRTSKYSSTSQPPLGAYKYSGPSTQDPGQTGNTPGQTNTSPGSAAGGNPYGTMGKPIVIPEKK